MSEPTCPRAFWPIGDDEWAPYPTLGAGHYVSGDRPAEAPKLLVPDRQRGGYREHEVRPRPKGRIGFR
jgi:hypothetical protein